ncbi:MAG TPA: DUF6036 family nucleotidyltransferase [Terriglobia bacterium]|nr:DUF6036 family nucleotidyltransferase [Terriglobia bacterium]
MSNSHKAQLSSPWAEFLEELDALLPEQVELHCVGGFVVSLFYGLPRPTADIDYVSVLPDERVNELQAMAGQDSALARKYKIHVQHVAVNSLPEDYEARLAEMFCDRFKHLRLRALDPYDLILSKLERNSHKDRDDVGYLAKALRLKPEVLRERYMKELRPYLVNQDRHDLTLDLWLGSLFQEPSS